MTAEHERLRADGAAFCIAHRLRYDPQLNVGCVLCQRAFSLAPERERAQPSLLGATLLGVLAGMLLGVALELAPLLSQQPARASAAPAVPLQGLGAPAKRAEAPLEKVEQQDWQPSSDFRAPPLPDDAPQAGLPGAAVRGDLAAIDKELAAGASIDELDSRGLSPLLWALRANRPDAASVLIERGARVDLTVPGAFTPLMLAADMGLEAVSALLLQRGASPATVERDGMTALMLAARGDHRGVVASLLARGAEVGPSDGMGRSALMHAAQGGASAAVIDALIARGARIEALDMYGATALLLAAEQGRERSVRALLARGAQLNARDQRGYSALDRVVQPRPGASAAFTTTLEATLDLLIASKIEPRLTIDPATTPLQFRPKLDALYARLGLPPLPPYQPLGTPAPAASAQAVGKQLEAAATVQLLAQASGWDEESAKIAGGVLIGFRGWTSVPKVIARAAFSNVALYGEQRATLVGDARGNGAWDVADVLLLELMENGRLSDLAFAGPADGIEVHGTPVRRLGPKVGKLAPGSVDLTPWLSVDGRQVVVTALSSWRGGHVSDVYLRVDGAGAGRTLGAAEIDRSGTGGTL